MSAHRCAAAAVALVAGVAGSVGFAAGAGWTWTAVPLSQEANQPSVTGTPDVLKDPNNGDQLAFTDAGGQLEELQGDGSGPVNLYGISQATGQAIVGSPTSFTDPGSHDLLVFADSSNGHMVEFDRSAGTFAWHAYDLTAANSGQSIAGTPRAMLDPVSGDLLATADSSNGDLIQFDRSPSSGEWAAYNLTTGAHGGTTIAGDPRPIDDPQNNDLLIFARGTNGHLEEFDRNGGGAWTLYDISGAAGASVSADPVPLEDPADKDLLVFADGPGNHLLMFDRDAASFVWGYSDLTSLAGTASASSAEVSGTPDAVTDPQTGDLLVFAVGTGGHLLEWDRSGSGWTFTDLTSGDGLPEFTDAPAAAADANGGGLIVDGRTNGAQIVELRRAAAPVSTTTSPSTPTTASQPVPPTQTTTVPAPAPTPGRVRVRVRLVLAWSWSGNRTHLKLLSLPRLPAGDLVTATCAGRGCPFRRLHARPAEVRRLVRRLRTATFRPGDRFALTISAPGATSELIRFRIRTGRAPLQNRR